MAPWEGKQHVLRLARPGRGGFIPAAVAAALAPPLACIHHRFLFLFPFVFLFALFTDKIKLFTLPRRSSVRTKNKTLDAEMCKCATYLLCVVPLVLPKLGHYVTFLFFYLQRVTIFSMKEGRIRKGSQEHSVRSVYGGRGETIWRRRSRKVPCEAAPLNFYRRELRFFVFFFPPFLLR